jgi:hypothetical protein
MKIIITEQQFNLIILSEGAAPTIIGKKYKDKLIDTYTDKEIEDDIEYLPDTRDGGYKKIFNKPFTKYSVDDIKKEINSVENKGKFNKATDLPDSLQRKINELDRKLMKELFPKPGHEAKLFDKPYAQYTFDDVDKELEYGKNIGRYKIRTQIPKALYDRIRNITTDTDINLLDKHFPKDKPEHKLFDKPYTEYTIDEIKKEVKQNINLDIYSTRTELHDISPSLYEVINMLDNKTPNLNLMMELIPEREGKLFDKHYTKYTIDEIRLEVEHCKDVGIYTGRTQFQKSNRNLADILKKIKGDTGIDLLEEFFPSKPPREEKKFNKPYSEYTIDELRYEISYNKEKKVYSGRSELSDNNRPLRDKIRKIKEDTGIDLLEEFFPDKIESYGELLTKKWLENKKLKKNVGFIQQKEFCDLKNINCLKLDFYLPKDNLGVKFNVVIEFDGSQHFQAVSRSKNETKNDMDERLKLTQKRDSIKNEYCKKNGIKIYRIKHNSGKIITEKVLNEKMSIIFKDIDSGRFNLDFNKTGGQYI